MQDFSFKNSSEPILSLTDFWNPTWEAKKFKNLLLPFGIFAGTNFLLFVMYIRKLLEHARGHYGNARYSRFFLKYSGFLEMFNFSALIEECNFFISETIQTGKKSSRFSIK